METLLRGEKPSEVIPFSLDAPVLYVPVRHHSPVCAYQLERIIQSYRPDIILVEGPENANDLIPVLTHADTRPPVALYYSYRDQENHLDSGEEPGLYRCYYPFVDCSPELVALRAAEERKIPVRFMDLSYARILMATAQAQGLRSKEEKISYASDRYLTHSRFQKRLCEKAGLRHFEEFWEKYFEIGGMMLEPEAFFRLLNVYCLLTREHTPDAELMEDGCFAREQHMAQRIREAREAHQKVLVVAGGFHIYGLLHPRTDLPIPPEPKSGTQAVWPMRYTMPAMDALSGYASGMPCPGFYERVWNCLREEKPEDAWNGAVLDHVVQTGRRLRKQGDTISPADEIAAMDQARGLAALREKPAAGLYELQDSVLSCFVKGQADESHCQPLRILAQITTGDRVGQLCQGAPVPPLTLDFDKKCDGFRLRRNAGARQILTLSIFSNHKHRQISRFLHRTVFLGLGFATLKKGPDPVHRKDRNLIREIWEYRWSTNVDGALVECSLSGATVEEACTVQLRQKLSEAVSAEAGAALLVNAMLMGLGDPTGVLRQKMEDLLIGDGGFASLCSAFASLDTLKQWQKQYGEKDAFGQEALTDRCFMRILQLLPSMYHVDDRNIHDVQDACVLLCRVAFRHEDPRKEQLLETLESLTEHNDLHPALHGTVLGLLYGTDSRWKTQIDGAIRSYLQGTPALQRKSAAFLQGLFLTARDLLLVDPTFLEMIDELVGTLEEEAFLILLPELRLAFSYFLPMESDRIAGRIAKLHQVTRAEVQSPGVDPAVFAMARDVDRWALSQLDQFSPEGGTEDGQ